MPPLDDFNTTETFLPQKLISELPEIQDSSENAIYITFGVLAAIIVLLGVVLVMFQRARKWNGYENVRTDTP